MTSLYPFLREKLRDVQSLAILGAGSPLKADDAAGIRIVEQLQKTFEPGKYPELLCCVGETAPENFSGKIRRFRPTHLLVIDAADLGLAPGSVAEIPPERVGGPTYCSHMLPLRVMIDYLAGETGCAVTLLGMQYQSIEFDGEMTAPVRESVGELSDTLRRVILECWGDR